MRYSLFSIVAGLVLCLSSSFLNAQATGDVKELLAKLPADEVKGGQQVLVELVKLGPAAVKQVVVLSVGDDVKAKFAINGLAFHVSRPGAEAERAMFAQAVLDVLGTEQSAVTQSFLIGLLQLAGKDEAVAALSSRLKDAQLCEPATQALLCIKTPAATQALIEALPTAKEGNRGTIIRALGVLRVTSAVDAILPYAAAADVNTRHMALYALANIGSPKAEKVLASAAEATAHLERAHATALYLLFAQRLAESGNQAQCVTICRQLIAQRKAAQENNVVCNALSTMTKAIGEEALADLVKAIDSDEHAVRAAALALIQPMTGENATAKLVGKLAEVDAPRRAEIVSTLGYRGDAGARSAAMKALDDADAVVRVAAIGAVARGATSEGITSLLSMLNSRTGAEAKAIQDSLARMPGEAPLAAVARALPTASASARVVLLQILASRRDRAHVPVVLVAMTDADGSVRLAAIKALGELGEAMALPKLIDLVVTSKGGKEQTEGMQSVVAICQRNSDAQKRAEPVLGALSRASGEAKAVLIRSLSQLGGTAALEAVIKEASGGDAAIADAAVRTLADWREVGAAGALLKISQSSEKANHRVLALRGYLRLVGLRSDRPAEETIEMYQEALKAAQRPDEKRLALAGLSSVRTVGALKVVATYLEDEALAAEAAMAAVKIALPQKESEQSLKGAEVVEILRKVAASAKDPAVRNQASRYVEGAEKR